MALVLRNVKGSRLTFTELDGNFTYLQGLDLSGVTFNSGSGLLTLTRNNGGTLSTTISGLTSTDQFVSGGTFNISTDNIDFVGNSTDTTFSVDLSPLISTVSGDTYVISGNADAGNQTLTFTNNSGGTFNVTNAAALFSDNDINVTGGTYNPTSGCVTFVTNSGTTFDVCGFLTGMTDTYVTGYTYNNANTFTISRTDGASLSASFDTVTGLTSTGNVTITGTSKTLTINDYSLPVSGGTEGEVMVMDAVTGNLKFHHGERLDLQVRNDEGANLDAGTPVYSKGEIGGSLRILVGKADASDPTKMPTIGILAQDLNTTSNKDGYAVVTGVLNENITPTNSPGLADGDIVYVCSGGTLTTTKPIGTDLIQNVGIVLKTNGTIIQGLKVSAIGRTNDVPNIQENYFWLGDSDGVATPTNFTSAVSSSFTGNTSGTCISDLWVSNIHSCSPLNINPNDEGNIYFGSSSGVTINVGSESLSVGASGFTNYKLWVKDSASDVQAKLESDAGYSRFIIDSQNTNDSILQFNEDNTRRWQIAVDGTDDKIKFTRGDITAGSITPALAIDTSDYVGLGLEPSFKLDVFLDEEAAGSTETTILNLNHDVGTDLDSQKLLVSFNLDDANTNGIPQVQIGAEVGENGDGGTQTKEGSGSFIVHTASGNTTTTNVISEKMRVDYRGNVGIGETSPSAKLHLGNPLTGQPSMKIGRVSGQPSVKSTGGWFIADSSGTGSALNYYTSDNVILAYGGGDVGIGTSSPTENLHVTGNTRIDGGLILNTVGGTTPITNLGIDASGNVVSGTTGGGGASVLNDLTDVSILGSGINWSFFKNGITPDGAPVTGTFSGNRNVALSPYALYSITSGEDNISMGYQSMFSLTSGVDNVAFGDSALRTNSTGSYNIAIGRRALFPVTGTGNIGIGQQAGTTISTGTYNTIIGYQTDFGSNEITTGDYNISIGMFVGTEDGTADGRFTLGTGHISPRYLMAGDFGTAGQAKLGINLGGTGSGNKQSPNQPTATLHVKGQSNTDSTVNFLIQNGDGDQIMRLADSGENVFIGLNAGDSATAASGINNICIGKNAGTDITTHDNNVLIGYQAGTNVISNNNIMLGYRAGEAVTSSTGNIFMGYDSGKDQTENGTTAIGYESARNINGRENTVLGYQALKGNGSSLAAWRNVAIGYQALTVITTGDNNVAVGLNAGDSISTGSNNTFIGDAADGNATADNQIGIGAGVTVAGANTIDLGNASITTANIPVAWTVTSDSRTKKDILTCDLGLDFVNALLPKKYKRLHPADYPDQIKERRYKSGGKNYDDATGQPIKDYYEPHHDENTYGYEYGLVAQDVKSLMDGNSTFNEFSGWKEEVDGTQGLQYQTFIPPIIKAIQELDDKVGGGSGSGVAKKVITDTFVGDTPKTLQHNLNDEDVIVQVWDASNELITPNAVLVQNNNEISVEVSQSGTYTVIITGGILNGVILTGTTSSGGSGGTDGFTGATKNGVSVNTDVRHNLNLIEGPNISLNVLDNQSNDSVDVTISAEADQYSATTVNSGVITWDTAVSTQFEVTLTENATLNLEGLISGQYGTMIVTQDNTGGRTLTLGTVNGGAGSHKVVNGGGGELVLTVNPNAIDIISFTYNGTNLYWTVGNDYT